MAKEVIKFYANWCNPCSLYAPTFEKVKQELQSEEITFKEVNVDEDTEGLAGWFKVRGIPTTIILENKNIKHQQSGNISLEKLKELINS